MKYYDFDWAEILSSESVLRASSMPEDILRLSGKIKPISNAYIRVIIKMLESSQDLKELFELIIELNLDNQNLGTLLKLAKSDAIPLSVSANTNLIQRGFLN